MIFLPYQDQIEQWFAQQWRKYTPPFYCSVDLRHAGFKLAPVDTNLFPAGFNHLPQQGLVHSKAIAQNAMARLAPQASSLLIIPENHTRNQGYFKHLDTLKAILNSTQLDVKIGALPPYLTEQFEPVIRVGNRLKLKSGFDPDVIILNNDLSSGPMDCLNNLDQTISPSPLSGWANRLKSVHFEHYTAVASEFSKQVSVDPWLIMPLFQNCGDIDFMTGVGEACLVKNTSLLLQAIQEKYDQYHIKEKPFVVVKADTGTYGMAVMVVDSPEHLKQLNRKQRVRMSKSKGGRLVNRVILQEGIHTKDTIKRPCDSKPSTAEPVVYMMGENVLGGFYRTHPDKGPKENLNTPGMAFEPLEYQLEKQGYDYSVVARLALLSAARELTHLEPAHSE